MKFSKWLRQKGPKKVAKMLETESPIVYAWLRGDSTPKALTMQKLIEFGKGAFSYDDIINDTKKLKLKTKKA